MSLKSEPEIKLKYPLVGDKKFQKRIFLKKEFRHEYSAKDGDIVEMEQKGELCKKDKFVLSPHQEFIKNFLHPTTPYNGVILYHGMGSGKTCSAIGIAEQFRKYNQYDKTFKKIFIVASPNVQENFKLQLFDENKLSKDSGVWNIDGCLGSTFLAELKDYDIQSMSKEEIVSKINRIIKKSYLFLGYEKLANIISKVLSVTSSTNEQDKKKLISSKLERLFENSLIVIDEAHNIRLTGSDKEKKTAKMLDVLTSHVKRNKILLLTGTPMYNDAREIIYLLNLLRKNDGLSKISMKSVFDGEGNMIVEKDNKKSGQRELIEKATGYISYVRGENPYNFPFKIFPRDYKSKSSIENYSYPTTQHNDAKIETPISFLDLYVNELNEFQKKGYMSFKTRALKKNPSINLKNNSGYKELRESLYSLNICYPNPSKEDEYLTGKPGLLSVVMKQDNNKFSYIDQDRRFFNMDVIGEYSKKIKKILEQVQKCEGIVLIYSQYIDAGLLPIAFALEELGMTRIERENNLFSPGTVEKSSENMKYAMITGDIKYSPNNNKELARINDKSNITGNKCKVVLISQAGSEGIDFKNLRQVHVLEPWFNLNRVEQIIGRAIRYCSHQALPLKQRNCQIFLHASYVDEVQECADMYIYRKCEEKSKKIGKVQRLLKSISLDCLLNQSQNIFANLDQVLDIQLSTGEKIKYNIQDKPFSLTCDYQDTCGHKCMNTLSDGDKIDLSTFKYEHSLNMQLVERIKHLFTRRSVYKRKDMISLMNIKPENMETFYGALSYLIENDQEYIVDKFGKKGNLINIKDLYIFQPIEFTSYTTVFDKQQKILMKPRNLKVRSSSIQSKNGLAAEENNNPSAIKSTSITKLLDKLQENYTAGMTTTVVSKKMSTYYLNYSSVVEKLNNLLDKDLNISETNKESFLIEKMLESLSLKEEYSLVKYLFHDDSNLDALEEKYKNFYKYSYVREYLSGEIVFLVDLSTTSVYKDSLLPNFNSRLRLLFKGKDDKTFRDMKKSELLEIAPKITSLLELDKVDVLPRYVTFNGFNAKLDDFQPKIKNTQDIKERNKNSKGRFFINETPKNMFPVLNYIVGKNIFKGKQFTKEQYAIVLELCSKIKTQTDNKRYFLNRLQNTETFVNLKL